MANRYWVGGAGTWDNSNTANWSDTTGGSGGFSVPTVGDDVFFDNNSGAGIVTVNPVGTLTCSSVTYDSNTLTKLYISVSLTNTFNVEGTFTLTQGTLHVSNPNGTIQFYKFISSNTNVRSVILERSISISGSSGTVWDTTDVTNLTTTLSNVPYISVTIGSVATTISPPNVNANTSNVFDFNITGGTGALTINSGSFKAFRLSYLSDFLGTWDPGSNNYTIYSNFFIGGGFTQAVGTHTFNFINTTTSNFGIACFRQAYNVNFSTTSTGGWSTTNLFNSTGTTTLISGPFANTGGLNYICGRFVSSNTNTRSIAGTINVTETSGTVWDVPDLTGLTVSSSPTVNYTGYGGIISHGNVAGGSSAKSISLTFSTTTTNPITITAGSYIKNLVFTGNCTWTPGVATYNIYGDITLSSGMTFNATGSTFKLFSIANVTSAGKTFDACEIASSSPDTVTLIDDLTLSGTLTLTSGYFSPNGKNITCDRFSSSNSNSRRITFSSAGTIMTITGSGTVWNMATSTNITIFNPQNATINLTYSGASPVTFTASSISGQVTPKINVTAGTYSFVTTTSRYLGGLNFTGFSGTWAPSTIFLSGSLILSSTMTFTSGTSNIQFQTPISLPAVASTITSAGNTFYRISVIGSVSLSENLILTNYLTHLGGNLSLNNFQITAGSFSGSSSNTRTIAFGTGNITITGSGSVWLAGNSTGLTCTGSRTVNLTYAGASAVTIDVGSLAGPGSESNALDFNITAGTYSVSMGTAATIRSLNFTGFTGTWTVGSTRLTLYGSLTLVSGMTFTEGTNTFYFAGTSGTQTITSAGKTLRRLQFDGVGGTYELADNLTVSYLFDFNAGTFNTNGYNITAFDFVADSGTLNLSNSTITILNSWQLSSGNFNAGTSTIKLSPTAAGTYSFLGGQGYTYYNLVFDSPSVTGQIFNISNGYTVNTISSTKTVAWTLIISAQNTATITFANWAINGTSGNLVTLNSSVAGSRVRLVKSTAGTLIVNYMNMKDMEAVPGTWYATNSIDSGNNSGWVFGFPSTGPSYFLMF